MQVWISSLLMFVDQRGTVVAVPFLHRQPSFHPDISGLNNHVSEVEPTPRSSIKKQSNSNYLVRTYIYICVIVKWRNHPYQSESWVIWVHWKWFHSTVKARSGKRLLEGLASRRPSASLGVPDITPTRAQTEKCGLCSSSGCVETRSRVSSSLIPTVGCINFHQGALHDSQLRFPKYQECKLLEMFCNVWYNCSRHFCSLSFKNFPGCNGPTP